MKAHRYRLASVGVAVILAAVAWPVSAGEDPAAVAAQLQADFEREKADRAARAQRDAAADAARQVRDATAVKVEALRKHEEARIRAARAAGPVTLAQFSRIEEWMTYAEVVAILGKDGVELSHSYLAGYDTVMYAWSNRDGSNMNAMFQNDRLVQKAQFGLR